MTASIDASEGRVEVTGGRIWYRVVGRGQAVPLVTVHGGPGFTHDYLEPLEALADERPVVFYDQLGNGKSDAPNDVRLWTNDRMIEELGQLLDALNLDRLHLLGQSWGTIVAAEYALKRPDRLAGLVLANPCLSLPRFADGTLALRAALPTDVRATLDRHEMAGTTDSTEYEAAVMEFNRRHLCRLEPWPEPLTRTQINHAIYEHMQGPNEFTINGTEKDYDGTQRLSELAVPTLFLCGRHDEARPEETSWYHSLVPGAKLVIFEHSSHVPHLEEPEHFLQVLRDFLNHAEGATPGAVQASTRLRADGPVSIFTPGCAASRAWKP